MATRNLRTNQDKTDKALKGIQKDASKSIKKDYKKALQLIRGELLERIEKFGKLDTKKLSKFDRKKKLYADINGVLNELFRTVNRKIRRNSDIQMKQSYFRHSWCVDQNIGVALKWRIGNNFKDQIK